MALKRVVITGLGTINPLGNDVASTWSALMAGKSGAAPITLFDSSKHRTQFACEVKDFDPNNWFDFKEQRKLDRYTMLAYVAALEAFKDAALEVKDPSRVGVIVGSGVGGLITLEQQITEHALREDHVPHYSPFLIPSIITDIAAGYIAIRLGLKGPNFCTTAACASSAIAFVSAMNHIRLGKADAILAGGSEAEICSVAIGGFNALRALSTRNDNPATASRPFSASRDGFVAGEGAACVMLEEYEHAVQRGAHIYAELVGYGSTADAFHLTAPDPEGEGAKRVMLEAIRDAGIKPEDVDYINTHGTSTPIGDLAEAKAVIKAFGEHAYEMNLSSTKSMTGHLLGASGALEALITILALYHQVVPPTINHAEGDDDPNIDPRLNFTFNTPQKRNLCYAISNAFGFGGHNAALAFRAWQA
ncbi:MAG: beta-ketoacyl-ACP synthase II [Paludibacteraceae bacterium]|nr:beta-ketoacyl-ACP synthase II [Paludibacteraceae bacterium]